MECSTISLKFALCDRSVCRRPKSGRRRFVRTAPQQVKRPQAQKAEKGTPRPSKIIANSSLLGKKADMRKSVTQSDTGHRLSAQHSSKECCVELGFDVWSIHIKHFECACSHAHPCVLARKANPSWGGEQDQGPPGWEVAVGGSRAVEQQRWSSDVSPLEEKRADAAHAKKAIEGADAPAPRLVSRLGSDLACSEPDPSDCFRAVARPPRYRRSPLLRLEKWLA
jgi:hypothetical protein